MISTKIHQNITDISATEWDSIISDADIFHTHHFLSALQESNVENADYQYIIFYKNGKIVASAVLSVFVVHLDLLVPQHPILGFIKRIFPNFFKIKMCFCGTPVSIGQRNLILSEATNYEEILPILETHIQAFSKEKQSNISIFKEFYENDALQMEKPMNALGYFRGYTLPYLKLPIVWKNFDEYQKSMRSNYRHQLKKSWQKITKNSDIAIQHFSTKDYNPSDFYHLYNSVLSRADVKLETLNETFFHQFFEKMQENTILLSLVKGESEHLATVLIVAHGEELTFVWAGKPDAKSEYDDYFNLMAAMVKYAIEHNFSVLNFGQVAFYTKQRLGGETHQLHLFFKSYSFFWHQVIRLLKNEFFPKIELDLKRVFFTT